MIDYKGCHNVAAVRLSTLEFFAEPRTVDDLVTTCGAIGKEQRPNHIHGRIKTADQNRDNAFSCVGTAVGIALRVSGWFY